MFNIWNSEMMPGERSKSVLVPIFKNKGDAELKELQSYKADEPFYEYMGTSCVSELKRRSNYL